MQHSQTKGDNCVKPLYTAEQSSDVNPMYTRYSQTYAFIFQLFHPYSLNYIAHSLYLVHSAFA